MENLSHSSWIKQHALPTVSREAFLVHEAIWGDIDARNEILISYLPLIRRLARQVCGEEATYELSDISNYWCFLFLDKFEKFNPELWNIAVFIKTYVFPEMKDYALNLKNIISVPLETKVEITEDGVTRSVKTRKLLFEYLALSRRVKTPSVHIFLTQRKASIEQSRFSAMLRVLHWIGSLDIPVWEEDLVDMIPSSGMTPEESILRAEIDFLTESFKENLSLMVEKILMETTKISGEEWKKRAIDIFYGRHGLNEDWVEITLRELATRHNTSIERIRQIHVKVLSILSEASEMQRYIPILEEIQYQ